MSMCKEVLAVPKVLAAPFRSPDEQSAFANGKPTLVIPGMFSGNRSTALLRASLSEAGFDAHGWQNGLNVRVSAERICAVENHIVSLAERTSQKVLIIGWSLGGLYARLLAQRLEQHVDLVMTLGAPFSGDKRANNTWRVYEAVNNHEIDHPPFDEDISLKPKARTISIWSSRDGIVLPTCSAGTAQQSDLRIELPYRHFEFATSRGAIKEIIGILREELRDSAQSALAVAQLPVLTDAEIERRLPVWSIMSDTFLDTELDDDHYHRIAEMIAQVGYSKQELETIYRCEVEPAFSHNLLDGIGEWAGWQEEFVRERVLATRKSAESQARPRVIFRDHVKSEWTKISRALDAL
ncbi:MAG: hypothetical protein ABJQ42_08615 [Erythrobacter sp.]